MIPQAGESQRGTSEHDWLGCGQLAFAPLLNLSIPSLRRVVVIAPHPDDEVLAVGGMLRVLAYCGVAVDIVAVTDGERSHPHSSRLSPQQMADRRAAERALALSRLGLSGARVTRLRYPDAAVARCTDLAARLTELVEGASLCFAPWELDGQPDHDASGRAALVACAAAKVRLLQFPVWAWHWARPHSDDLPWSRLRRNPLPPGIVTAKCAAIAAYRSQIMPLGPGAGDGPVLPREVAWRFERSFETVFE